MTATPMIGHPLPTLHVPGSAPALQPAGALRNIDGGWDTSARGRAAWEPQDEAAFNLGFLLFGPSLTNIARLTGKTVSLSWGGWGRLAGCLGTAGGWGLRLAGGERTGRPPRLLHPGAR